MIFLLFFIPLFAFEKVFINLDKNISIPKLNDKNIKDFSVSYTLTPAKFYISKYEITKKEYNEYLKAIHKKPIKIDEDEENEPVTNVSFFEAQEFCKFYKGRVPTEKEWIIAASIKLAKSKCFEFIKKYTFTPYPTQKYPLTANDPQIKCMLKEDDEIEPSFIGSEFLEVQYSYENINGIYGMLGNAFEWVDEKVNYFNHTFYKIKGGSYNDKNMPIFFDSRVYSLLKPSTKRVNVGFRCVWEKK